jgi:hypothetical protein
LRFGQEVAYRGPQTPAPTGDLKAAPVPQTQHLSWSQSWRRDLARNWTEISSLFRANEGVSGRRLVVAKQPVDQTRNDPGMIASRSLGTDDEEQQCRPMYWTASAQK